MTEETPQQDSIQEESLISTDIIKVSRSNEQFHFFAHEDLSSAELIFFIRYLKKEILPAIINRETS